MWNQSQTKAFIGTLNSHLAGCSTGCLRGCGAVWAAGPAGEEFSAAASSLDLQQRKNRGADPGRQSNNKRQHHLDGGDLGQRRFYPRHFLNLHPPVTKWQKHGTFVSVSLEIMQFY